MVETFDYPVLLGEIEVRARGGGGGRTLSAVFSYGKTATRSSAGRVRKERFASGSLSWQVREFEKLQVEAAELVKSSIDAATKQMRLEALEDAMERRNTHLLVGHDYNRAIADMRSGTLAVEHTADAVNLTATLPDEGAAASWIEDAVKGIRGKQVRGVSPGFQVPAKGGERLVPEEGPGGSMVREILDAVAFEYSLVSRPTYAGTSVDTRAWEDQPRRRRRWL